ncbi:Gfo/Idh/MocA family protein [Flavobacterium notoginsengisoli]|uniref:Gfo/Idh/MocA family protein n=1 Tax=Flavobacterium notoginsengisoli TaxID=1478199 RepID=UPI0036397239
MKVLIIGLGSIAKKHIEALKHVDKKTEIYALRRKSHCDNIENIKNIYDINTFDMKTIDFVIISNPTSEHLSTIQKISLYNKPLFIEKPLFSEINDYTQLLVNQLEEKKTSTYVACNLRFLDCLTRLKDILKSERINEVNVYCGSYLPDWRPGVDFRTVYSANKELGGGVHIDLIHELDYVFWLFGEPIQTKSFFSNVSSLNISAYDYANYLWSYNEFSASIILNYFRKESKRTIELVTERGTYFVDLLNNTIMFNEECIFISQKRIIDTYKDQMYFYINTILKDKKKFNSITEANTILKLCMQD